MTTGRGDEDKSPADILNYARPRAADEEPTEPRLSRLAVVSFVLSILSSPCLTAILIDRALRLIGHSLSGRGLAMLSLPLPALAIVLALIAAHRTEANPAHLHGRPWAVLAPYSQPAGSRGYSSPSSSSK